MPDIVVYKTEYCGYCTAAIRFLEDKKGVQVRGVDLTHDPEGRMQLVQRTGLRTVPQIFIGDTHVGGYDDLIALERAGKLDDLLG